MRAEPGPTIKVLLPSVGIEGFCSTLEKLSVCFGELGDGAGLLPVFIRVDARQLAEKGARPLALPDLAREVEELARRHPKVSFTTRLEGTGSVHTWQVSVTATKIPVLSARRVSVLPSVRNYEREVAWAEESIRKAIVHSVVTSSPDYSEFIEWALPQAFYVFQKVAKVPHLKHMAEAEFGTGAANPIWPISTELVNAIANQFGAGPIRIPESEAEQGKLLQQMDACFVNEAKAVLDRFLSSLGVSADVWFK